MPKIQFLLVNNRFEPFMGNCEMGSELPKKIPQKVALFVVFWHTKMKKKIEKIKIFKNYFWPLGAAESKFW